MDKQAVLEQYQRRLIELGFPSGKLPRKVEELCDYHANLKRTALKDGLEEPDAEARATSQLGDPVALAIDHAAAHHEASWWGRHPILGFIVLPVLSLFPAFILAVLLMFGVALLYMTQAQWQTLFQNARSINDVKPLFLKIFELHLIVLTIFALPFCWMARRSGSGLRWTIVVCAIFAFQGMFFRLLISPRNVSPGYTWDANWLGLLGPLLLVLGSYYRKWQKLKLFPPMPAHLAAKHGKPKTLFDFLNTPLGEKSETPAPAAVHKALKEPWLKRAVRMPTYWIIIVLIFGVFPLIVISKKITDKTRSKIRNNNVDVRTTTWPAEREQTASDVAARQGVRETTNETIIDLGPHINLQLTDSSDGNKKSVKDNSLSELPSGHHIYGGIPFDVQGRIQLMGVGLERWQRVFPAIVRDIKIGRKCNHIFLFHGENCAGTDINDQTVAKLVLHYTDGSRSEIEIKSAVNLLDWWGPIFKTNVDKRRHDISSPDSELAWVGQNPFIKKYEPEWSLRLYKSTFDNPQPSKEITTIDYVSTMTTAAPFMVAMTIE